MDGSSLYHWVTPHETGTRYSAVAYSGGPAPKTRTQNSVKLNVRQANKPPPIIAWFPG
jgi:hypothetical protein